MTSFSIVANLVDIQNETIYPAEISIENGLIKAVDPLLQTSQGDENLPFALPGFIDAHVHIESSMLVPAQFARLAVVHGTVATVSDPHEIANVCGMEGVDFMIENGRKVPFKFYFGAPSCVPATTFETAGASIDVGEIEQLLSRPEIHYLSEMMNFPGVLSKVPEVIKKIEISKQHGKPVDGHAPGLRGELAQRYMDAGISTDHECFTYDEALDKLQRGMKILIREGSAARNFDALIPLLHNWYNQIMFCSDDKHPDSLIVGHINQLCARAINNGIDLFKVLRAACLNPIKHYNLKVGQLLQGNPADFILVKDLNNFEVLQTYIDGNLVAEKGVSLISNLFDADVKPINRFECQQVKSSDFNIPIPEYVTEVPVIEALDGQLITNRLSLMPTVEDGFLISDTSKDVLKIAVINRYASAPPALGFIKNFGLKRGAIASSVVHDSHNIVVVGCDDEAISLAVNTIISAKGGICATNGSRVHVIELPVGGLMTFADGYKIAAEYSELDKYVKQELGATLTSPFMTLSFMALLVIPHLKMSDMGLFDGDAFGFVSGER